MNRPDRRSLPAHDAGMSPMAGRSADASRAGPWATMLTAFSALALAGGATVGYYAQSAAGHLGLMYRARPIETVIAAPDTEPRLAARLRTALDVRGLRLRCRRVPRCRRRRVVSLAPVALCAIGITRRECPARGRGEQCGPGTRGTWSGTAAAQ